MPLRDYEQLDEDDFYGQDFGKDGVVSIWVGLSDACEAQEGIDVLQDLCGVGYYDIDNQEVIIHQEPSLVADLVGALSYSESFSEAVVRAAAVMAVERAWWVVAQYDFAYDPARVKRPVAVDPRFLGVFGYHIPE